MISLLLILCLFIVTFWSVWKKSQIGKAYFQNVPSPKGVPLFGNTLELIQGPKVYFKVFSNWLKIYGDTILMHDGPFSVMLITMDYGLTQHILNSAVYIDKGFQYSYLHRWLGDGLLTNTGIKWKTHRKAITPSFHFSILQKFIGIFEESSSDLITKLKKEVDKDSVELMKIMSLYTLSVICEAAMGLKIADSDKTHVKYVESVRTLSNIVSNRTMSPLHPELYPYTWNYYKEIKLLKFIHQFIDEIIDKKIDEINKKDNAKENEGNDTETKERLVFLDHLLKTTINGRLLTKDELRDEVNAFMFAGHDTTASTLSFCLYNLSIYPTIQNKVLQEQFNIFGEDLKNAIPTYSQLNEMKYLEMVIKETLRLSPAVPLVGRQLSSNLEYNGTVYPKGLNIMIYIYGIHRNPKFYPDPEKFIPERFEAISGKYPFSYVPFSAGLRNCIGQRFAMFELLSSISKVVRYFELKPAKPYHHVELSPELILVSNNGVRLSLSERK